MNSTSSNSCLASLREQSHPGCFVCGRANGHGLGLDFHLSPDGAVEACFACGPIFTGYPGMLHGGIICALLDGAMTNCLFARGLPAVTVDLKVRFHRPVTVGGSAVVRAWLKSEGAVVHELAAEVLQDGHAAATAEARFIDKEALNWFGRSVS